MSISVQGFFQHHSLKHDENFPVASFLSPAKFRGAIIAIYQFARYADNLADEGNLTQQQRLSALENCEQALQQLWMGQRTSLDVVNQLNQYRQKFSLPLQPFLDLLSAFKQDCVKQRYTYLAELEDYCRRSANPIGRLLLHLYECQDPHSLHQADQICTGLQLINFYQDIAVDVDKGRIYLPQELLSAYQINEQQILNKQWSPTLGQLLAHQALQAKSRLEEGKTLSKKLAGRIGLELRFVIAGGGLIAERISAAHVNLMLHRPHLTWRDSAALLMRSVLR